MESRNAQRRLECPKRMLAAAASALLAWVGLAAPAAAQGVIATGSGRAGATVAGVVGLIGFAIGWLALARSGNRVGTGSGRDGAIVALVLGLIGTVLGRVARARSSRTH